MDNPSFYNLIVRGGVEFRGLIAHAGSPIYIELISHMTEDNSGLMTTRQDALWQPLRAAAGKVLALQAERFKAGESNVKGHLFFSVAVGQIDALAQGTAPEVGIYEAARRSLQFTYDILRAETTVTATAADRSARQDGDQGRQDAGELTVNGQASEPIDPFKDLWTDFSLDNLPSLEAEGPWVLFGWDGPGTEL